MADNPFNPFANVDFSKTMGDLKIPGFDVQAIMDAQRKNIEALTAANQTAVGHAGGGAAAGRDSQPGHE